jgi:hypothetical protein
MDLSFNQVNYDGELSDFSEEELRELVGEFETAQESNVAEFRKAAEAADSVDDDVIEDFEEAREALIDDITEADTFEDVPLTEEQLEESDFSELQEWKDFVADDGGEEDADFDDFGQRAETEGEDDEGDFAEDVLGDMPGVKIE